jgi:hypoxanthine phosphoribosyltransferase
MAAKTYDQISADMDVLLGNIGDYRPDIIVPCMLGGLIPGAMIAYRLGIDEFRPITIGRSGDARFLLKDIDCPVAGKELLLVEDDLPTGRGPAIVRKAFMDRGAKGVKVAALYVSERSLEVADFCAEICRDGKFPNYPWKPFRHGDKTE